jgi:hypothetical protein
MHAFTPAGRWLATILALGSAGAAAASPAAPAPRPLEWRPAAVGLRSTEVAALALAPGGDRLAIGDAQGALVGTPGQPFRRVLHRGPVLDLAFLSDGALLAATGRGLYRIDPDGGGAQIAPGPGDAARSVRRIAAVPGLTALATGDGLFVSRDARVWQRLAGSLPSGEASAVALRRRGHVVACWGVVRGELWRVDLELHGPDTPDGEANAAAASRAVLPFATRDGGAVDIAVGLAEAALVVVFPQALAVRGKDAAGERWEILRPELPPGARALRLGSGAGRHWLATDRGLLEAARLSGPWRRTTPPAGTSAIRAAVGGPDALFAAASDGVLAGRPAPPPAAPAPAGGRSDAPLALPPDPPISRVHRAALRYLGLDQSRMEALRRGARRRAWWPIVGVRGSAEWDHSRNTDRDQAFLSGDTRHLIDREYDSEDAFEVSLSLPWDLGGVAYEPESIDVSHETREVIELRDDVLDEITQLYFERRGGLAALAEASAAPAAERRRLRLRADELAAGIDAWTGGWFGRQVPALAP